jgi:hypothetical protein
MFGLLTLQLLFQLTYILLSLLLPLQHHRLIVVTLLLQFLDLLGSAVKLMTHTQGFSAGSVYLEISLLELSLELTD